MLSRHLAPKAINREDGQVLILWILFATIIFVIGAIVVDFGLWFTERRRAQTAADAAAIAAATKLDNSDAETITMGRDYASRNGYTHGANGAEVMVTPQYNNNPELVEVTVDDDAPVLFLDIFGVAGNIGARAVASLEQQTGTSGAYAIFANQNNNCGSPAPLVISGSDNVTVGAVHSNSDIEVSGSDNDFDNGEFTHGPGCGTSNNGQNNDYPTGDPSDGGIQPMPLNYTWNSFPCSNSPPNTFRFNGDIDLSSSSANGVWMNNNPNTKRFRDNIVICATGDVQLSTSDVIGTGVTLVAGDELKLSGSNWNVTGYWNSVLAFSSRAGDGAIDLSGSGGIWTGFIFAPNGQVKIQGQSNFSIQGSVIADRVLLSGSDFSINATGFPTTVPAPPKVKLVE